MIVVADTSPVNYLILIGHIEILRDLFGTVLIPQAVLLELKSGSAPSLVRDWAAKVPGWVEVQAVRSHLDPATGDLGNGEREAIALSLEIHAELLVADDQAARSEAQRLKIPVIGTLGVLRDAAMAGLLNLKEALDQLQQTSFHVSPDLILSLLDEADSRV